MRDICAFKTLDLVVGENAHKYVSGGQHNAAPVCITYFVKKEKEKKIICLFAAPKNVQCSTRNTRVFPPKRSRKKEMGSSSTWKNATFNQRYEGVAIFILTNNNK